MTVRDIDLIDLRKGTAQNIDIRITGDHKHPMAHLILRSKIIKRFSFLRFRDNLFNRFLFPVSQKDRSGLCADRIDVADAVFLFFRPGIFVFFNKALQVVVDGSGRHDPGLGAVPHRQLIKIIGRLFFPDEIPVLHAFPEKLLCLPVNFRRIGVHTVRKRRLRAVDGQK